VKKPLRLELTIHTHAPSAAYDAGWERIFGKKKRKKKGAKR
jgi:hypothetical protein